MTVFQPDLHLLCHLNYALHSDLFDVMESSKPDSLLCAVSDRAFAFTER